MISNLAGTQKPIPSPFLTLIINDSTKLMEQMRTASASPRDLEIDKIVNNIDWNMIDFNSLDANQSITILESTYPLGDVVLLMIGMKYNIHKSNHDVTLINSLFSSQFFKDTNWFKKIKLPDFLNFSSPELKRIGLLFELNLLKLESLDNFFFTTVNKLTLKKLCKARYLQQGSTNSYTLLGTLIEHHAFITLFEKIILQKHTSFEINQLLLEKPLASRQFTTKYYDSYLQMICSQLLKTDAPAKQKIAFIEKIFSIIDLTSFGLNNLAGEEGLESLFYFLFELVKQLEYPKLIFDILLNNPEDFCQALMFDTYLKEFFITHISKNDYNLFSFREVSDIFPNKKDNKLFSLIEKHPKLEGKYKLFSLFHFIKNHLKDKSETLKYLKEYGELYASQYSSHDNSLFYHMTEFLKDLDELPVDYYLSLLPKISSTHESYTETIIQAMPLLKTKHDLEFLKQCLINIKSQSIDNNKLFYEASNAFYVFATQQTERKECLTYLLESMNALLKTDLEAGNKKLFIKIFISFMNEEASKPVENLSPLLQEWINHLVPSLEQYKSNPTLLYYTMDLIHRLKSNNIQKTDTNIWDLITENSKPLLISSEANVCNVCEESDDTQLPPLKKTRFM